MLRLLISVLFITLSINSSYAAEDDAKKFVSTLGDKVLEIVKSKNSNKDKEQSLIDIFNGNVDTEWMGKFVLGKYNKTAPQDKMEKYKSLYNEYVMGSYIPRFRDYTGEKFRVTGARKERDSIYIVTTEIIRPNAQAPVKVDYRLIEKDSFKIVDIVVEGVSLITTQRSEFGSIISNSGFNSLLAKMEQKIKTNNLGNKKA